METVIEINNLDKGIKNAVLILRKYGFETFESCDGSFGHCFFEPTVRFFGTEFDLIRAYEICILNKLPVFEVKRVYRKVPIYDNKLKEKGLSWDKPFNEITFNYKLEQ